MITMFLGSSSEFSWFFTSNRPIRGYETVLQWPSQPCSCAESVFASRFFSSLNVVSVCKVLFREEMNLGA